MMSKWNLSSTVQAKLRSLCESLDKESTSNTDPNAEANAHIKQYWESHLKHTTTPSTSSIQPGDNTSSNDFFKPLLPGIWRQCFVSEFVDDESSDEEEEDKSDEEQDTKPDNQSQEDSFLAELSQMFD